MNRKVFAILVILLCCLASYLFAQTPVKRDSTGNYSSLTIASIKGSSEKDTGKTFTDSKGVKYPVFESTNGKLFYYKTAKSSGNVYKVYLKVQ